MSVPSPSQLEAAYTADSTDPRIAAALHFAQQLAQNQGHVSDDDVAKVLYTESADTEIAEIVGHVALNVFTNYFNTVADPRGWTSGPAKLERRLAHEQNP